MPVFCGIDWVEDHLDVALVDERRPDPRVGRYASGDHNPYNAIEMRFGSTS